MKFIKFTEEYLEKFFEDNVIEDDNLYEFLKGREGIIEETTLQDKDDKEEHMILDIKIKMREL
jgi:hypothetical protein